jgi:hypothetical protein
MCFLSPLPVDRRSCVRCLPYPRRALGEHLGRASLPAAGAARSRGPGVREMLEVQEALLRWEKPALIAFSDNDPVFSYPQAREQLIAPGPRQPIHTLHRRQPPRRHRHLSRRRTHSRPPPPHRLTQHRLSGQVVSWHGIERGRAHSTLQIATRLIRDARIAQKPGLVRPRLRSATPFGVLGLVDGHGARGGGGARGKRDRRAR